MTSNNTVKLSNILAPSFHEVHKKIKSGDAQEVWCKGGRGSTKSSFLSIETLLTLQKDPKAHAFISRRYDNELRDSVYGQMQWAAHKLNLDHIWRFMVSPMQAVNQVTGQKILFRGVDNPIKAKSINLGFGYIKVFWAEEVDQYGSMEELRTIMQSLFRGEGSGQMAFFSFNPPKSARAWVNAETKIKKVGRVVHSSDYRTVPTDWLGERFLADAEHLRKTNETAYRHEYLGEEIGTGLEVFNNVKIEEITDQQVASFDQIRQGLDFGYAVDPVSFGRMHFDRKKRTLYIFREVYGIGVGNRALFDRLAPEERRTLTIADSAEPKSIDELKGYGMNIRGATKGPGSVEHGIKWLSELERIVIDPARCPNAAREFVNYALELNRQGEVISRYPDKDNHCISGNTMIQTINGECEMKNLKPGESVLTREGYKTVLKHWSNGYEEVIRINETLEATGNHIALINGQWNSIDTIRYGDILLQTWKLKQRHTEANRIIGIRSLSEELTGYISRRLWSICTEKYGKTTTGRYQKGIMFTISMEIQQTIALKILNYALQKNISLNMRKTEAKSLLTKERQMLTESGRLQKNGTDRKKEGSGTQNTQRRRFLKAMETLLVRIAEKNTQRKCLYKNIAQMLVNLLREGNLELTILERRVLFAEKSLSQVNMQKEYFVPRVVQELESAGKKEVFDITVDGCHEFFAGGYLVHNCIDMTRYSCSDDMKQTLSAKTNPRAAMRI